MGYPYPYFCLCAFFGPYVVNPLGLISRFVSRVPEATSFLGAQTPGVLSTYIGHLVMLRALRAESAHRSRSVRSGVLEV